MMINQQQEFFNHFNTFFNHIYVLTIERAKERQEAISKEFEGLNFNFFYGFDKKNLDNMELEQNNIYSSSKAIKNSRYNKPMKLGEIACSMGHKAIYEDMIANNYSNALILEDDVSINNEPGINLENIFKQLPKNWDLVYFDYFKNDKATLVGTTKQLVYHLQKKLGFLKWSHTTISNLYAKPFSANLKIAGYHDFTSAYAINLKTAKLLIEKQTPICNPADHALSYIITNKLINAYITVPKIFFQKSQTNKEMYNSYVE
ncbi:MAG TPA: glycosyltransferase family 25 protein [Chitinophagaceae bacterium]|nr:glycosyltransferase family 25 protein [Chitinophagaceae bacterium]HMZ46246.1 glycosyltransferase family 25 protein [Chitinophagaceae bacterium]HNE92866.1 glycosyltransferase family 25 protein [Chitinophagaceae bacterium]HNF30324.1 glycosyltransferase family 25 protein [Chitinophagaceae bacterium]HNJ58501.1 glycosyltransferase family 25 protein [Chitinophagaceae bacterium]